MARMSTALGSPSRRVTALAHQCIAVAEIHVGGAGRAVERAGARGVAGGGVAAGIVLAEVGLGLHDPAAGDAGAA